MPSGLFGFVKSIARTRRPSKTRVVNGRVSLRARDSSNLCFDTLINALKLLDCELVATIVGGVGIVVVVGEIVDCLDSYQIALTDIIRKSKTRAEATCCRLRMRLEHLPCIIGRWNEDHFVCVEENLAEKIERSRDAGDKNDLQATRRVGGRVARHSGRCDSAEAATQLGAASLPSTRPANADDKAD